MKKQQQNVRSKWIKIENEVKVSTPLTKEKWMQDVYIKIHNKSKTMHSNQTGHFPEMLGSGNQYIMV